jgi:CBS domain containing-hemolysin-like protein
MTLDHGLQLGLLLGCIVMIGLCCAAEAAYVAAGRAGVRAAAKDGNVRALLADRLLADRTGLLAQLLIGVNVFTVSASVLSASLSHELWGAVGPAIAAPVLIVVVLVFAEILPKRIAYSDAPGTAIRLAPLARSMRVVFGPFSSWFTNLPLWLARSSALGAEGIDVTPETLAELLRLGEEEGALSAETGDIVLGILSSSGRAVREIMTPRDSVVMVSANRPLAEAAAIIAEGNLSRLPVLDAAGRVAGVLHAKDVAARLLAGGENVLSGEAARPVLRVTDSTPARSLLSEMRRRRQHLAVITDLGGRLAGLVTMHDLLEEILG